MARLRGLFALAWLVLWVLPAAAETRIALVIGNGGYVSLPRLANPPHDARALQKLLSSLGFSVDIGIDLDREQMDAALIAFARKARQADVALVFFGGHGVQYRGINYLAPVDAAVEDEADLRRFITAQQILEDLQSAARIRILVLDACRDNKVIDQLAATLPASRSAGLTRGLGHMAAPVGSLVAFSTQADAVAADGEGENSPFVTALLHHMGEPGVDVRLVFARARAEVYEETQHRQVPELSDSLVGEFAFNSATARPAASPVQVAVGTPLGIAGTWSGQYFYPGGQRPPVMFTFEFDDTCRGRSEEPNTFGNSSTTKLFANLSCHPASFAPGQRFEIIKTYDGTGGVSHSVTYVGTISADASTITGQWLLGGTRGNFEMRRD